MDSLGNNRFRLTKRNKLDIIKPSPLIGDHDVLVSKIIVKQAKANAEIINALAKV